MTRNILFISRCPPYPLHFGDRLILWHLARELSSRGYTLDLVALTQHAEDHQETNYYEPFFNEITLFPEVKRTSLMYVKRLLGRHYPSTSQDAWQSDMWHGIQQKLTEKRYDVVHLFGGVHVYEFAHLVSDLPTVITPYESYSLYLKRALAKDFTPLAWVNLQLSRQFERWMFSLYNRTVVLTEQDKVELLGINPTLLVDVIPNGINLEDFQPRPVERDKATLLFVGNYAYPPNHDAAMLLLTEIFPKISARRPDAKLLLVGNAPSDEMHPFASDTITITGRVDSVQDYLASATIFLCPLRVGAGIKNKVLEALAIGIPTIATPLSMEGIHAEIGKHALVASIDNMADTTLQLLDNVALQHTLAEHAPQLIEQEYSWKTVTNQYETLYKAITD